MASTPTNESSASYHDLPRLEGFDSLVDWERSLTKYFDDLDLGWALIFPSGRPQEAIKDVEDMEEALALASARAALLWTVEPMLPRMRALAGGRDGGDDVWRHGLRDVFQAAVWAAMHVDDEARARELCERFAALDSRDFASPRAFGGAARFLRRALGLSGFPVAAPVFCRIVVEGLATSFPELRPRLVDLMRSRQLRAADLDAIAAALTLDTDSADGEMEEGFPSGARRQSKINRVMRYLDERWVRGFN